MPTHDCPLPRKDVRERREQLDAAADSIRHEQASRRIEREAAWARERPDSARRGADRALEAPFGVVGLDAIVGRVRDVCVARRVARERARKCQLTR